MEAVKKENEQIVGTVSKILKIDEAKNYAVVVLKSDDIPEFAKHAVYWNTFIAIGSFTRVVAKQELRLTGKWTRHAKFGWRFIVNGSEEVTPTCNEAIIRYLSSGLFKGIGEKTAILIVDKFGENTLEIIKDKPELLSGIKGISRSKVAVISNSYKESANIKELAMRLKLFNVSDNKIVKIYKKYQNQAIEILEENPYVLCEIDGFGFKTADSIARAFNIDLRHKDRLRQGIFYVLEDAANKDGHLFLTKRSLLIRIKKILNNPKENCTEEEITKEDIYPILEQMKINEEIVIEDTDIYLPVYYGCEKYCGHKISQMKYAVPTKYSLNVDKIITDMEHRNKITYAPKQKDAMKLSGTTNIAVITGGPGTGKTTIIKGIIEVYKKNYPSGKIILAAPTGRAAKRMEESTGIEAKTIHRLLGYKYSHGENKIMFEKNEKNPLDADLLIIDESSMIDIVLLTKLLKAIVTKTKVIFVGDADQLPSVGPGNVFRDLIESRKVPLVMLNEIFRQANTSKIVVNAALMNKGDHKLEFDDNFVFIEENDNDKLPEIIKKIVLKESRNKDISEVQVLSPFRTRTSTGVENLNKILQEALNPKVAGLEMYYGKKTFRKNDRVMQYKNNYDKDVFNGDVGVIECISKEDDEYIAEIKMGDKDIKYSKEDFEELDLAYANTIHKSQGSEYPVVIIPVTTQHYMFLKRNVLYTAITRAKIKVVLVGQWKALTIAIKDNKIAERNSKLKERI